MLTFLGREVVELFGLVAQERLVVVVVIVIPYVVLVFVMTANFNFLIHETHNCKFDQNLGSKLTSDTLTVDLSRDNLVYVSSSFCYCVTSCL